MEENKPMSLVACIRQHFGMLPGQGLMDFQKEYKALTDADKKEMRDGLIALGYNIAPLASK